MIRSENIVVRVNAEERTLLAQLAQREERTASDVVRRLIRQAAHQTHDRAPARPEGVLLSPR
jgi:hypothetical protein